MEKKQNTKPTEIVQTSSVSLVSLYMTVLVHLCIFTLLDVLTLQQET